MARSAATNRQAVTTRDAIAITDRVPTHRIFSLADNFNRANGDIGNTSTDNLPWEVLTGTWTVLSNKGKQTAAVSDSAAVLDLGYHNGSVEVFLTISGAGDNGGLVVRATDANNWLRILIVEPNQMSLTKRVAGVNTSLATATPSVTQTNSYLLRVVMIDGLILCYLSAAGGGATTLRITHRLSDADYAIFGKTKTKVGIYNSNKPATLYDTFAASFDNRRTATP